MGCEIDYLSQGEGGVKGSVYGSKQSEHDTNFHMYQIKKEAFDFSSFKLNVYNLPYQISDEDTPIM